MSLIANQALLQAHQAGNTHDEEKHLSAPLSMLSPKNLQFALTRLSMRTLGRLSSGIRARKQHLRLAIGRAAQALTNAGQALRILNITAGHGRKA